MDLNELDFNNMGDWPIGAKSTLIVILCAAVGYGWYHFSTSEQINTLEVVKRKELELRTSFENKQKKAVLLEAYELQLQEMNESFGAMLKRLPNKTEVASLLIDVSQTGLAAGLEFQLFQPTGEAAKEFYAELPIKINVTGQYHQFGQFISGLAALPRIVTIHDVIIKTTAPISSGRAVVKDKTSKQHVLQMDATVKTYRYLEENTL
ncbi:type 4a pilus biogenesis protein PilO [Thiospirillum jenense]|uniref:Type 4a pilus biogenesis protein PilO n=1 Tax=Thiospirillum jenense TaxID=1653858 RepID=A0A839HAE2_9GAMM|nr:type 4a pilus biogenesis protein PilO [Thiospirillum jenense]MBB1125664.1 type 4a pilus biogenesis protein PilO [Thiospirillum jenense]